MNAKIHKTVCAEVQHQIFDEMWRPMKKQCYAACDDTHTVFCFVNDNTYVVLNRIINDQVALPLLRILT